MDSEQLIQKILRHARKGISRNEIMSSGWGSQKELRDAIKEAKAKGMYSVPDLNPMRGTYYQFNG